MSANPHSSFPLPLLFFRTSICLNSHYLKRITDVLLYSANECSWFKQVNICNSLTDLIALLLYNTKQPSYELKIELSMLGVGLVQLTPSISGSCSFIFWITRITELEVVTCWITFHWKTLLRNANTLGEIHNLVNYDCWTPNF